MQDPKPAITELINPRQWIVNYADYLYRYAITRTNDEEQAKDLVQETFLAGLERVNAFEGKSSERTWLTAILKHKIIDLYRKKSNGLNTKTKAIDQENFQQDFFNSEDGHWKEEHRPKEFIALQEDSLQQQEFNKVLQRCMKKLPELWSAVFSMKHIDEESTAVICTALKVTPSNFWVIIHRTKLSLRACLQKHWI